MEWENILSAVLAGGISGQIVTLVWGSRLTESREYKKWQTTERYKLYSALLSVVTHTPKDQSSLNKWTYEIRDISQRIHILFDSGTAPEDLADSIESVFKLAQLKKDGEDTGGWDRGMRVAVRNLRFQMSSNIKTNN
jgi:hypothetical protein